MLALAGLPLGLRFRFLDPNPDCCARHVGELVVGAYDDPVALERFARGLRVATFEFENVPAAAAEFLASRVPTFPPPAALATCQDRLLEKQLFTRLGIPTNGYTPAQGASELRAAIRSIGLPCVVKSRRMGYDGKGQAVVRTSEDEQAAIAALAGVPVLVEEFVPFDREVSVLVARGRGGAWAFYPLAQNTHEAGILRVSIAPAPHATSALIDQAQRLGGAIAEAIGHVGVLAVECFEKGGTLLANEIAPRVHNSGHWTIEGAETSQFENHLRVVLGWPLGSTALRSPAAMINFIGTHPPIEALACEPGLSIHLYDKAPKPGRKIGHATILGPDSIAVAARAASLRQTWAI